MTLGLSTLASTMLAVLVAGTFGPLLGRLATQWFSGRGLSNLLTEIRGAFLPFLVAPLVLETFTWPSWVVVGSVIGASQAIAVGRWIARRSGEWSPSLLGGIALGRSRAALQSARATARGAIVSTMALTFVHIVALEMLLSALGSSEFEQTKAARATLFDGTGTEGLLVVAVGTGAIIFTEVLSSWVLQRRPKGTAS